VEFSCSPAGGSIKEALVKLWSQRVRVIRAGRGRALLPGMAYWCGGSWEEYVSRTSLVFAAGFGGRGFGRKRDCYEST